MAESPKSVASSASDDLAGGVHRADEATLREQLGAGGKDSIDDDGWPLIGRAAHAGHLDLCAELAELGADLDAATPAGGTALMFASASGHTDIVDCLLQGGADASAIDGDGRTSLINASRWGHTESVKLLLQARAAVGARYQGKTALAWALQKGHDEIAELLRAESEPEPECESEPEPEPELPPAPPKELSAEDQQQLDAELLAAAQSGDAFAVAGLCEFGADVNTKDDRGQPIIRLAARRGHAAVVSELAQAGAELEARGPAGDTALMAASEAGEAATVQTLLRFGADASAAKPSGDTALTAAACLGYAECVWHLLADQRGRVDPAALFDGKTVRSQPQSQPLSGSSHKDVCTS